jgi:3-oxoacyl-[acyl-carrier-protein] synthase II
MGLGAISSVFGTGAGPAISSTKSATGLIGAAGGIEAVFAILAIRDGIVPPTLNLTDPDPAAEGLDLVAPTSSLAPIDVAMTNGFGFGGVNASALFRRMH